MQKINRYINLIKNIIKGDKNKLKPVSYRFSFNFLCKKASKNFSFSKTFQIMNQNFFLLAILSSRHLLSQNVFTTQIVRPLTLFALELLNLTLPHSKLPRVRLAWGAPS